MYGQANDCYLGITGYELERALKELTSDGNPIDPDELHQIILKKMGPNMKELLLTLFNRALEDKEWPFSNNDFIFIPKPRKDLDQL